jgi:hypothetical protein
MSGRLSAAGGWKRAQKENFASIDLTMSKSALNLISYYYRAGCLCLNFSGPGGNPASQRCRLFASEAELAD